MDSIELVYLSLHSQKQGISAQVPLGAPALQLEAEAGLGLTDSPGHCALVTAGSFSGQGAASQPDQQIQGFQRLNGDHRA